MQRNFKQLAEQDFDVIVVGGGIYGAWTAYDAALKGQKVALLDKGDWACGTSSASSKLIHGGLRYLEHFQVSLVHHALDERRTLARIAPHQVDPIRFFLPVYETDRVGRSKVKLGLSLYDRLAGRKQPVGPHESFSTEALTKRFPFLYNEGLKGGFSYGDCQEDDARITLEVVHSGIDAGVCAVNYARVNKLLVENNSVTGVQVQDELTGEILELKSKVVVNTTGPWASDIMPAEAPSASVRRIKGIHLVLPRLPHVRDAFLLTARSDGRVFFVIPWYEHTLIGTTEAEFKGNPDDVDVSDEEIDYLLEETRHALGGLNWTRKDLCGAFAGMRTLILEDDQSMNAASREFEIRNPMPGLVMPVGGKFTTARRDSAQLVRKMFKFMDWEYPKDKDKNTKNHLLAWAPEGEFSDWLSLARREGVDLGMDEVTWYWCAKRHRKEMSQILDLIREEAPLAERIHPDAPFCKAEIIHASRHEMAVHLIDILRRRMPLSLMTPLSESTLQQAAALAAAELNWDANTIQEELQLCRKHWPIKK